MNNLKWETDVSKGKNAQMCGHLMVKEWMKVGRNKGGCAFTRVFEEGDFD